jgi:hypothetical protein
METRGLLPCFDRDGPSEVRQLVEFWNQVRSCDEQGQTSWETLEMLEREVTECLAQQPPDIDRAQSVTAKAMLLITGQYDQ